MRRLVDQVRAAAIDLDGTLVDSAPDLAVAANATLQRLGAQPLAAEILETMIGDGFETFVERALTRSLGEPPRAALLARARDDFRDQYGRALFVRSRIYPGVMDGLDAFRGRGIALCCVTNKASVFTEPLLAAAGLRRYFSFVLCADRSEDRKPSPRLLHRACGLLGVAAEELLMVGDSPMDVAAARAAGSPVVLAAYGYHHTHGAPAGEPDWVVDRLDEIPDLPARGGGPGRPRALLPRQA